MLQFPSRLVLVAAVSWSVLAGSVAPVLAQEATPGADQVTVLGPDDAYAGATRGEWDARWTQWSASFPERINPNLDVTGQRCGYGQSGPVFFLPGNFRAAPGTMTCVVPEGMAIFVLIGGVECSTVEAPPYFGRDEDALRACAAAGTDVITDMELRINGQAVPDLETYRSSSPLFPLTFPEDNIYGAFEASAGVAAAVTESYNVIIAPPPPGEYEIVVSAVFEVGGELFPTTYQVMVQAPRVIEPGAAPDRATPVS